MSSPTAGQVSALVGYDGSLSANAAIDVAARLLPDVSARVLYLWEPPYAAPELRHRLVREARTLEELMESLEREGAAEAARIAALGTGVARAAGWTAEPVVQRSYGGNGYQFARLAEEHGCDVVVVGSRGMSGVQAVLGSVSEVVVHVSTVPVLVVPHPLTSREREACGTGPVLVGVDGSATAERAVDLATALVPGRTVLRAEVGDHDADPGGEVTRLERRGPGAGGVAAALGEYAAEQGAGVVVVGSRGQSTAREVLLGSVVRALLHQAQRPVLVIPPEQRFGS